MALKRRVQTRWFDFRHDGTERALDFATGKGEHLINLSPTEWGIYVFYWEVVDGV